MKKKTTRITKIIYTFQIDANTRMIDSMMHKGYLKTVRGAQRVLNAHVKKTNSELLKPIAERIERIAFEY